MSDSYDLDITVPKVPKIKFTHRREADCPAITTCLRLETVTLNCHQGAEVRTEAGDFCLPGVIMLLSEILTKLDK
jgi:hypothetical protein